MVTMKLSQRKSVMAQATVTTVRTQPAESAAKPHILGKENTLD